MMRVGSRKLECARVRRVNYRTITPVNASNGATYLFFPEKSAQVEVSNLNQLETYRKTMRF